MSKSNPEIKVTQAEAKDLTSVLLLNKLNVPKVSEVDLAWLKRYLEQAPLFAIARIKDSFAGYMIGMEPSTDYGSENFHWFKKRYGSFLYVDRLAVESHFQGQGVGKALYGFAQDIAKPMTDLITCEVNIRPPNPQSYNFHKSLGFSEVGQQETKGGQIRVAMLALRIS